MKFISVEVTNFGCYASAQLPLDLLTQACVSGENGAGKSTLIVDAPMFALYGKEHVGDLDSIVGPFGHTAEVKLTIEANGTEYEVTRSRKRGRESGLLITSGGTAVSHGAAEAQEFIASQILRGLTYRDMIASSIMVQGAHSTFTNASPKEAKEIVFRALGLEDWQQRADAAKENRHGAEGDVKAAQAVLDAYRPLSEEEERLVDQIPLLKSEIEAAEASLAAQMEIQAAAKAELAEKQAKADEMSAAIDRQKADRVALETAQEELSRIQQRIANLELQAADGAGDITTLKARLEELEASKAARDSWNAERRSLEAAAVEAERLAAETEQALEDAQDRLDRFDDVSDERDEPCPTCKRPLGADAEARSAVRAEMVAAIEAIEKTVEEAMEAWRVARVGLQDLGPEPSHDEAELISTRRALEKALDSERIMHEVRSLADTAEPAALKRVAELKERASESSKAVASIEALDLTEVREALSKAGQAIADLTSDLSAKRATLANAEAAARRAAENADKISAAQFALEEAAFRARAYRIAERAFGRDGIPAYLMEAAIPKIEEVANGLLDRMSDGKYQLRLATQVDNKSGTSRETLEIMVYDGRAERSFQTFSGGEKFRINFALRVALAEVIAAKSGTQMSMLIIDEPEGLDERGRAHLIQCIQALGDSIETVILISHHEDLRDSLPQRVVVAKSAKGSTATVACG